jgi:hypothetical protein
VHHQCDVIALPSSLIESLPCWEPSDPPSLPLCPITGPRLNTQIVSGAFRGKAAQVSTRTAEMCSGPNVHKVTNYLLSKPAEIGSTCIKNRKKTDKVRNYLVSTTYSSKLIDDLRLSVICRDLRVLTTWRYAKYIMVR